MENLKENIEILKRVLNSIKLCTQPCDGHPDPNSIDDCWDEVDDRIENIEQLAKVADIEIKPQKHNSTHLR